MLFFFLKNEEFVEHFENFNSPHPFLTDKILYCQKIAQTLTCLVKHVNCKSKTMLRKCCLLTTPYLWFCKMLNQLKQTFEKLELKKNPKQTKPCKQINCLTLCKTQLKYKVLISSLDTKTKKYTQQHFNSLFNEDKVSKLEGCGGQISYKQLFKMSTATFELCTQTYTSIFYSSPSRLYQQDIFGLKLR